MTNELRIVDRDGGVVDRLNNRRRTVAALEAINALASY
jgi:hypothetical protein